MHRSLPKKREFGQFLPRAKDSWVSLAEVYEELTNAIVWLEKQGEYNFAKWSEEDAFIERAWDWIEDNLLTSNQQDKSRLYFEQFKSYMEGE